MSQADALEKKAKRFEKNMKKINKIVTGEKPLDVDNLMDLKQTIEDGFGFRIPGANLIGKAFFVNTLSKMFLSNEAAKQKGVVNQIIDAAKGEPAQVKGTVATLLKQVEGVFGLKEGTLSGFAKNWENAANEEIDARQKGKSAQPDEAKGSVPEVITQAELTGAMTDAEQSVAAAPKAKISQAAKDAAKNEMEAAKTAGLPKTDEVAPPAVSGLDDSTLKAVDEIKGKFAGKALPVAGSVPAAAEETVEFTVNIKGNAASVERITKNLKFNAPDSQSNASGHTKPSPTPNGHKGDAKQQNTPQPSGSVGNGGKGGTR